VDVELGGHRLAITLAPVNAATFGLCDVDLPEAAPAPGGGNAIVNVAIWTCSVDDFTIVEASLDGDSPFDIGPIAGNDSAAIDAALLEAANLLGQDPASLDAVMLSLLSETVDVVEEMASASSNTPALYGTDYLGDPDDYNTWIAIGRGTSRSRSVSRPSRHVPTVSIWPRQPCRFRRPPCCCWRDSAPCGQVVA
jgi:hypothetical protein